MRRCRRGSRPTRRRDAARPLPRPRDPAALRGGAPLPDPAPAGLAAPGPGRRPLRRRRLLLGRAAHPPRPGAPPARVRAAGGLPARCGARGGAARRGPGGGGALLGGHLAGPAHPGAAPPRGRGVPARARDGARGRAGRPARRAAAGGRAHPQEPPGRDPPRRLLRGHSRHHPVHRPGGGGALPRAAHRRSHQPVLAAGHVLARTGRFERGSSMAACGSSSTTARSTGRSPGSATTWWPASHAPAPTWGSEPPSTRGTRSLVSKNAFELRPGGDRAEGGGGRTRGTAATGRPSSGAASPCRSGSWPSASSPCPSHRCAAEGGPPATRSRSSPSSDTTRSCASARDWGTTACCRLGSRANLANLAAVALAVALLAVLARRGTGAVR